MRKVAGSALVVMLVVSVVAGQSAVASDVPEAENVQLVGQIGDSRHYRSQDVAVEGDTACLASGSGIVVIDVSDRSQPLVTGTVPVPSIAQDVVMSGGYVYAALALGLRVIDVSTPSQPEEVGHVAWDGWNDSAHVKLVLAGSLAFVLDGAGNLRIVDVTDPSLPSEIGFFEVSDYLTALAAVGDYLYVGNGYGVVRILDVSDPSTPTELGSFPGGGREGDMVAEGDLLYMVSGGVRVLDLTDPLSPQEVGHLSTGWRVSDAELVGTKLYVSDFYEGVFFVDVSDAQEPRVVNSIALPGEVYGVAADSDFAYVGVDRGGGNSGLRVIDTGAAPPAEVGSAYVPSWWPEALDIEGDYAYVGTWFNGLRIVDASDPARLREIGAWSDYARVVAVDVLDDLARIITYDSVEGAVLRLVNVSDPTSPALLGSCAVPWSGRLVTDSGYAYALSETELRVVDTSDPTVPTVISLTPVPGVAGKPRMALEDGHLYLLSYLGLTIVDVSYPDHPLIVGTFTVPPHEPIGLFVREDAVFLAGIRCDIVTLRVLSILDPANPVQLYSHELTEGRGSGGAAASGSLVSVFQEFEGGLRVYDVLDPATLTKVGYHHYDTADKGIPLVVADGEYVYVYNWESGLVAFRFTGGEPATPEEQIEALVAEVQNLIDTGVLNQGNGNALTTMLENALEKLEKGNTQAACNEMGAFVNLVEAFVNSGRLTEEDGQPLVEGAGSLIAELCGAG